MAGRLRSTASSINPDKFEGFEAFIKLRNISGGKRSRSWNEKVSLWIQRPERKKRSPVTDFEISSTVLPSLPWNGNWFYCFDRDASVASKFPITRCGNVGFRLIARLNETGIRRWRIRKDWTKKFTLNNIIEN